MMLWIIIAVMTAVAMALLLPPLLRPPRTEKGRAAFDIEVYRDQIDEIGRDQERGLISEREAEDARAEIGRRLLGADRRLATEEAGDGGEPSGMGARGLLAGAIIGVGVPLAAVALYVAVGAPELSDGVRQAPAQAEIAGHEGIGSGDIAKMVEQLGTKLQQRPDDAAGWALYARSLSGLQRYGAAVEAFRRAVSLDPRNAGLMSTFAEAQILAADGVVTPEARRTLESVVAIDPRDARARYFLGLADRQAGRQREALDRWIALESDSPADAPWQTALGKRIERLAQEIGIEAGALAAMRKPRPAAASGAGPQEEMIRGMVARLADRLKSEPDDVEGWRRLARSYQVLGETAKHREALAELARLLPDDLGVLDDYAKAIAGARDPNQPVPAELLRVSNEILKRRPNHPNSLWFVGLGRLEAGDRAGALELWRRLRGMLQPEVPLYGLVDRRIEELEKTAAP